MRQKKIIRAKGFEPIFKFFYDQKSTSLSLNIVFLLCYIGLQEYLLWSKPVSKPEENTKPVEPVNSTEPICEIPHSVEIVPKFYPLVKKRLVWAVSDEIGNRSIRAESDQDCHCSDPAGTGPKKKFSRLGDNKDVSGYR